MDISKNEKYRKNIKVSKTETLRKKWFKFIKRPKSRKKRFTEVFYEILRYKDNQIMKLRENNQMLLNSLKRLGKDYEKLKEKFEKYFNE